MLARLPRGRWFFVRPDSARQRICGRRATRRRRLSGNRQMLGVEPPEPRLLGREPGWRWDVVAAAEESVQVAREPNESHICDVAPERRSSASLLHGDGNPRPAVGLGPVWGRRRRWRGPGRAAGEVPRAADAPPAAPPPRSTRPGGRRRAPPFGRGSGLWHSAWAGRRRAPPSRSHSGRHHHGRRAPLARRRRHEPAGAVERGVGETWRAAAAARPGSADRAVADPQTPPVAASTTASATLPSRGRARAGSSGTATSQSAGGQNLDGTGVRNAHPAGAQARPARHRTGRQPQDPAATRFPQPEVGRDGHRNMFRKLGVSSRVELARAIRGPRSGATSRGRPEPSPAARGRRLSAASRPRSQTIRQEQWTGTWQLSV